MDISKLLKQFGLSEKEIAARRKKWKAKKPKETRGALAKYAKLVTSASEGAVTDNYGGKVKETIAILNQAVATEIVCVLRYKFHAVCATGIASFFATIAQASVWADCIKSLGPRFSYTANWHYQNVNVCKPFDLKSACRDGNCVSAQIDRDMKLLKDKTLPMRERVQALAFLIHFMGARTPRRLVPPPRRQPGERSLWRLCA